ADQHQSKYRPKQKGPGRLQALLTDKPRRLSGGGSDLGADADSNDRGVRLFAMDGAFAPKDAALVDDQRTDHDIAEHLAGRQDFQATRGADVALDRAA